MNMILRFYRSKSIILKVNVGQLACSQSNHRSRGLAVNRKEVSSLSLLIPMFAETFLGHVDDTHSERRRGGGAEAWRAVKPRLLPGGMPRGSTRWMRPSTPRRLRESEGGPLDPPGKIRGTPPTLLAPPDFTNDGVGSSPASASWEEGAMEAERLYLDNKRRRLDAPTETEATSPDARPRRGIYRSPPGEGDSEVNAARNLLRLAHADALAARERSRGEDVAQRAHILDRIRASSDDAARGDRRTRLSRAANRARRLPPRGEEDLEALPVAG